MVGVGNNNNIKALKEAQLLILQMYNMTNIMIATIIIDMKWNN